MRTVSPTASQGQFYNRFVLSRQFVIDCTSKRGLFYLMRAFHQPRCRLSYFHDIYDALATDGGKQGRGGGGSSLSCSHLCHMCWAVGNQTSLIKSLRVRMIEKRKKGKQTYKLTHKQTSELREGNEDNIVLAILTIPV